MTLQELHSLLKSRKFKSNFKGQSFIFKFYHVHLFREDDPFCDYELIEKDGNFFIAFDNFKENTFTEDFKNVLFMIDKEQIVINPDSASFNGQYNITFEGQ